MTREQLVDAIDGHAQLAVGVPPQQRGPRLPGSTRQSLSKGQASRHQRELTLDPNGRFRAFGELELADVALWNSLSQFTPALEPVGPITPSIVGVLNTLRPLGISIWLKLMMYAEIQPSLEKQDI
ncbi:hypothetical protein [Plesiocystis pacifica]|uniref:hypothetical protein n=1 Tax=Plesiocystis pacifica TaxID=191768 RepID=UPI0012F7D11E|nr:hypothetical protein [Plesiocystis pacifica]